MVRVRQFALLNMQEARYQFLVYSETQGRRRRWPSVLTIYL